MFRKQFRDVFLLSRWNGKPNTLLCNIYTCSLLFMCKSTVPEQVWNAQQTLQVIAYLHSYLCLWDIESVDCKNRDKKSDALDHIIKKMKFHLQKLEEKYTVYNCGHPREISETRAVLKKVSLPTIFSFSFLPGESREMRNCRLRRHVETTWFEGLILRRTMCRKECVSKHRPETLFRDKFRQCALTLKVDSQDGFCCAAIWRFRANWKGETELCTQQNLVSIDNNML